MWPKTEKPSTAFGRQNLHRHHNHHATSMMSEEYEWQCASVLVC